jgi:hypothetical protein
MQTQEKPSAAVGKDIGLLFKPDMIRALLRDESPKTQTRRIISPQPALENGSWIWRREDKASSPLVDSPLMLSKAPYRLGDRIYAKESLYLEDDYCWHYATDKALVEVERQHGGAMLCWMHHKEGDKSSALFMPKWAARIWREVTEVRVQRLNDISEEDAIAEGIDFVSIGAIANQSKKYRNYLSSDSQPKYQFFDPLDSFRSLWNSINGKWVPVRKGKTLVAYISYPWSEEDILQKPLNAIRQGIPCIAHANPWLWRISLTTELCGGQKS